MLGWRVNGNVSAFPDNGRSAPLTDLGPVAMDQYMDIISSPEAWLIADENDVEEEGHVVVTDIKPTISARRVKALVEQVTGMALLISESSVASDQRTPQIATPPCLNSPTGHAS